MPTFIYSSIAQSVERMTVNHDVTGSSPVGGAFEKSALLAILSLLVRIFFVFMLIYNKIGTLILFKSLDFNE